MIRERFKSHASSNGRTRQADNRQFKGREQQPSTDHRRGLMCWHDREQDDYERNLAEQHNPGEQRHGIITGARRLFGAIPSARF
jgi:hypothetical protein